MADSRKISCSSVVVLPIHLVARVLSYTFDQWLYNVYFAFLKLVARGDMFNDLMRLRYGKNQKLFSTTCRNYITFADVFYDIPDMFRLLYETNKDFGYSKKINTIFGSFRLAELHSVIHNNHMLNWPRVNRPRSPWKLTRVITEREKAEMLKLYANAKLLFEYLLQNTFFKDCANRMRYHNLLTNLKKYILRWIPKVEAKLKLL